MLSGGRRIAAPPEVYHANRGFAGRAVSSLSPSYSPVEYTPDEPDSSSDIEDDPEFREEVEASLIVPKLSGRDALGRKRAATDEDPGPEEDGGEGGAGSAGGGELRAPRRRRLRMDQVAEPHEEQEQWKNTARGAPQLTRRGPDVSGARGPASGGNRAGHGGEWPMLRSVFEQLAERGGGVTAARRAEFLELIRRRWRPEKGAASTPTDEEAIRSGSRAPLPRSCAWSRQ